MDGIKVKYNMYVYFECQVIIENLVKLDKYYKINVRKILEQRKQIIKCGFFFEKWCVEKRLQI